MPLLRFYLPPGLLTSAEKKELSQQLTKIYLLFDLPAFYVNIIFSEIPSDSFYVGGEENDTFIRLVVEHLARSFSSTEHQNRYMSKLDAVIKPLFDSKGYTWEYHIIESSRDLWKIQSIVPPPPRSEAEKMWSRENKAIPWE